MPRLFICRTCRIVCDSGGRLFFPGRIPGCVNDDHDWSLLCVKMPAKSKEAADLARVLFAVWLAAEDGPVPHEKSWAIAEGVAKKLGRQAVSSHGALQKAVRRCAWLENHGGCVRRVAPPAARS